MVQVQVCVQSRQLVHKFCKISNTLSKAKSLRLGVAISQAERAASHAGHVRNGTRKSQSCHVVDDGTISPPAELGGGHIESLTRGERGVQRDKHETARPKGKLSQALREANRGKSWTNHDPPYAEEVAQSCRCTLDFESSI